MSIEESLQKIRKSAESRGMSGDQMYFTFLHGLHEQARAAAEELARSEPTRN